MNWLKVGKVFVKYILPVGTTIGGIVMSDQMEKERMNQLADMVADKIAKKGAKA